MGTPFKKTVFLSDTHGFYDEMVELLQDEDLLDDDENWIAGDSVQLIHVGDTVDRGPRSVDTFNFFRNLQIQLGDEQVVRLMGNHEFCYCGGPLIYGMEADVRSEAGPLMTQDGSAGTLKFAHAFEAGDNSHLVVHAGLDPEWEDYNAMDLNELVDTINDLGKNYMINAKAPTFSQMKDGMIGVAPAILGGIGYSRGGWDAHSGVTWADYFSDLLGKEDKMNHQQIVGHSIQSVGINLSPGRKIWAINVPYGQMQLLRYDHEVGEFSTSDMLYPANMR